MAMAYWDLIKKTEIPDIYAQLGYFFIQATSFIGYFWDSMYFIQLHICSWKKMKKVQLWRRLTFLHWCYQLVVSQLNKTSFCSATCEQWWWWRAAKWDLVLQTPRGHFSCSCCSECHISASCSVVFYLHDSPAAALLSSNAACLGFIS